LEPLDLFDIFDLLDLLNSLNLPHLLSIVLGFDSSDCWLIFYPTRTLLRLLPVLYQLQPPPLET